jgi:hypothetical protein
MEGREQMACPTDALIIYSWAKLLMHSFVECKWVVVHATSPYRLHFPRSQRAIYYDSLRADWSIKFSLRLLVKES